MLETAKAQPPQPFDGRRYGFALSPRGTRSTTAHRAALPRAEPHRELLDPHALAFDDPEDAHDGKWRDDRRRRDAHLDRVRGDVRAPVRIGHAQAHGSRSVGRELRVERGPARLKAFPL